MLKELKHTAPMQGEHKKQTMERSHMEIDLTKIISNRAL